MKSGGGVALPELVKCHPQQQPAAAVARRGCRDGSGGGLQIVRFATTNAREGDKQGYEDYVMAPRGRDDGKIGSQIAMSLHTGKIDWVKRMRCSKQGQFEYSDILHRVQTLKYLNHENVACYDRISIHDGKGIDDEGVILHVLCEAEAMSLYDVIRNFGTIGWSQLVMVQYLVQILKGLQFLHGVGVLVRLKCSKILVSCSGICKIAALSSGSINSKTVEWTSPEVLLGGIQTTHSDIWSMGGVLVEMFVGGTTPFHHLKQQPLVNTNTNQPEWLAEVFSEIKYGGGHLNEGMLVTRAMPKYVSTMCRECFRLQPGARIWVTDLLKCASHILVLLRKKNEKPNRENTG